MSAPSARKLLARSVLRNTSLVGATAVLLLGAAPLLGCGRSTARRAAATRALHDASARSLVERDAASSVATPAMPPAPETVHTSALPTGAQPPGEAPPIEVDSRSRVPWLDRPIADVWPAVNTWNETMEREYAAFVERLGRAVATRRCQRIDQCLSDPDANLLYEAQTDAHVRFQADCADLPYVLRAYFAFKRRLPFGYVARTRGRRGRDPRYALGITPVAWHSWRDFRTPRALLNAIAEQVHSGMYRTAPQVETSDFYPIAISRRALRPGTVFYDPNGHVLVVAEVRPDGVIHLIDGHPDGSLTWKRFGQAFVVGTPAVGGGFRYWRTLSLQGDRLVRSPNNELPNFDARMQYDQSSYRVAGQPSTYHAWVRATLAEGNATVDPVTEFREQVRALCRDVSDRVVAVDAAIAVGIHRSPHPSSLPENIYGTTGDWEMYSTPSRDARLKAAFRELRETVAALPNLASLAPLLRSAWTEEIARPECRFAYVNSAGARVSLSMDDVLDRLFSLSFDPYHCIELRWGAAPGSPEMSTCHDDANKLWWYRAERRLRNRIDREYGSPTPLTFGPEEAPDVDFRPLVGLRPAREGAVRASAP